MLTEQELLTESDLHRALLPAGDICVAILNERLAPETARHQKLRGEEEAKTAATIRERGEEEKQILTLRTEKTTLLAELPPLRAEVVELRQENATLKADNEALRRHNDDMTQTHRRHEAERQQTATR